MGAFYYVYILVSKANDEIHYSGITRNLKARLVEHNRGKCLTHLSTDRGKLRRWWRSDRKRKRGVLNAILKTGSDVSLLVVIFESFRGCRAGLSRSAPA